MRIVKHSLSESFDTIEIYPISDVHIGEKHTDENMFLNFLSFILEEENRFIILNGDLANTALKNSKSDVYSEKYPPREQVAFLIQALRKVSHRILAITEGNHEERISRDTNISITEHIASALMLEDIFDETEIFLKVGFGAKRQGGNQRIFTFHVSHGSWLGGCKTLGKALGKMQHSSISLQGVDIQIVGHVHKKETGKDAVRIFDHIHNTVKLKERLYVVSSHWQDYGGYVAKAMYIPGSKGASKILLYSDGRMEGVV